MIISVVILALLTLLVATEPGSDHSTSIPEPAVDARGVASPGARRRIRRRQVGCHWRAQ
jgi:hypothetical protein